VSLSIALGYAARAAVLLLVALAAMPLLRRAPARVRSHVLAVALGASIALPLASFAASRALPGRAMPRLLVLPVVDPLAEGPVADPEVAPVTSERESAARSAPRPGSAAPAGVTWRGAAALAWALVALVALVRVAASAARVRRLVRRGEPLSAAWTETLAEAGRELGVRAGGIVTSEVPAPAVAGVLRPTLLLPPAALAWTAARRRVVALHELSHVAHGDALARLVAQIACALYWFVPPSWWAARRLRAESERAADERVVHAGVRATAYAEHLLAIARGALDGERGPSAAAAIGMAARPSELARRIASLVSRDAAPPRMTRRRAAAAWIATTSAALLVACAACASGDAAPAAAAKGADSAKGQAARAEALRAAPGGAAGATTIDARLQAIADDEAARVRDAWRASDVAVVILDPSSGAVLAMTGSAATRAVVPGSTMKVLTVAAAIDSGAIRPDQRFACDDGARSYGAKTLRDATPHGALDATGILAVSSNVGASRIYDALGGPRLVAAWKAVHLGEAPTAIDGAASGAVPASLDDALRGAHAAIGFAVTASPLQLAAAFGAVVDGGVYRAPYVRAPRDGAGAKGERAFQEATSRTMRSILAAAIESDDSTGKGARVPGVRVAGKTGTSNATSGDDPPYFASFVGAAPADAPKLVVYVGVDGPTRDGKPGTGGEVAAPAFARIATRALAN